jgi:hypothetical protein
MIAFIVVSDEPTDAQTLDEYGLRFDIEESFLDEKSGGYQIHTSELATPEAAFAPDSDPGHCHPSQPRVLEQGSSKRTSTAFVDTHWDRGLSYLKLGWRWRQQQYQRGWQAFSPFWLDPAPDPLPALASRRGILEEKKRVDLPTAV